MHPKIETKLNARLLVVANNQADYHALRWAFTTRGYRHFEIVFSEPELEAQLERNAPDLVLIAQGFNEEEASGFVAQLNRRARPAPLIHRFEIKDPNRTLPLSEYSPYELDTVRGRFGPEHIPLNLELELTARCNSRCCFCPIESMERLNRTMPQSVLDPILARARELPAALVYLCGVGEPLLYPDLVEVVRRVSTEIGCPVGINTNGQLLTATRFRELVDAGLSTVNISINGVSDEVYGQHMRHLKREVVTANIEAALAIKPNAISLQGVITRENHHEIPDLVRMWTEKGVRLFTFNQCSNKSGFLPNHDQLWYEDLASLSARIAALRLNSWVSFNTCNFAVRQRDSFLCRVPLNFISVDVSGNILHCMHDFKGETSYGKFAAYDPVTLRALLMERIGSQRSICANCNAPKLHPEMVLWNGVVVGERSVFESHPCEWERDLESTYAAIKARQATA